MKKLFVIASFLTIFLFLFGCQSETPISPTDQNITLDKGKPLRTTGNIIDENTTYYGFLDVSLTWNEIKKVDHYTITYQNALNEREEEITLGPENLSCTVGPVAWQEDGREFNVFVKAYKLRKGNAVLVSQDVKFFTYSGTTLTNYLSAESGSLENHYDASDVFTYSTFSANWDWSGDVAGIDHYKYKWYPSWNEVEYGENSTPYTSYSWQFSRNLQWPDNVMLIVWAENASGECLAAGYRKFSY